MSKFEQQKIFQIYVLTEILNTFCGFPLTLIKEILNTDLRIVKEGLILTLAHNILSFQPTNYRVNQKQS